MDCTSLPRLPGLSGVLASPALARLVLFFLLFPEHAPGLRELQRCTGTGSCSLQNEIRRMHAAGWIHLEGDATKRRVRIQDAEGVWRHLRGLAQRVARPEEVLSVALAELPGLEAGFIYGSVACGQEREESDVDVLLIGEPRDRAEFGRRSLEASALLGREINAIAYSQASLRARGHRGFLKRVLAGPKTWIVGGPDVLLDSAA